MKIFAIPVAAFILASTALPVHADDVSRQARVNQLFIVMHLEQMIPQMTQQMMAQIQPMMATMSKQFSLPQPAGPQLGDMQKRIAALIATKLNWERMGPIYTKIYTDTFTEEEIEGMITFYASPTGQALLKKTPLLTQNSMQAMQGIMGEMMAEMPKMVEEIVRKSSEKTQ